MPTSQGAIGNVFNFRQMPSLSLGCGSWGSNATAEALQAKHLLNYKQVCERREHVLWFKVPPSIYFNRGTMPEAFRELRNDGLRRAFIVTDPGVKLAGHVNRVVGALTACDIESDVFADVLSDPDIDTVNQGITRMNLYHPDVIIALGGGAPMGIAKMMRLFYEHPQTSLDKLYTRFMDMQKRIVKFPKLGEKIRKLVCIPTTSGTGAEMTPFAVVRNRAKDVSYPIADYSLTPDMAIIDADLVFSMSSTTAANSGFSAIVNGLESYVSMLATDYTQGLSQRAINLLFANLEKSVKGDSRAREACHNASAIAAMAFANAFSGICHSLAHQLTAEFNIPHGVACSLLICQVIKFNAEDAPSKQGTFPQYTRPMAKEHYSEIADSLCPECRNMPLQGKVDQLIQLIVQLKMTLDMPQSIKDFGVNEDVFFSKVEDLALAAFDDQCTGSNPRYPLVSELRQILTDAYFGSIRELNLSTVHDCISRQKSLDLKLHQRS